MRIRALAVTGVVAALALSGLACSSDDDAADDSTATTQAEVGNVLPPVILSEGDRSATVAVGTTVTFNFGDPGEGRFVAESSDASVFRVENEGKDEGTFTTNAGGVAVAKGTAEVTVQFFGADNGVGAPTTFTIVVE